MSSFRPFFNSLTSLCLLFIHLGCFFFISKTHQTVHNPKPNKLKSTRASPSSWLSIKRIFARKPVTPRAQTRPTSPAPSIRSSIHDATLDYLDLPTKQPAGSRPESDISLDQQFFVFPLRNDIYPCPSCGEIFRSPGILQQHQAITHAVSELFDGDSGKNIVRIIFNTGWRVKEPCIRRILKIHNSPKILNKFEEFRESVKLRAAANSSVRRRDERCIADGNELLRFHCGTFVCDLGQNGNSMICNRQYCSVCGIIRSGFSSKMDGISTFSSSWKAHVAIPEEIEVEFDFMNVKRAMLVCRVIAGRVGSDLEYVGKEDPGFDSVVGRGLYPTTTRLDEDDELVVFNPRAVLPCFLIIYSV